MSAVLKGSLKLHQKVTVALAVAIITKKPLASSVVFLVIYQARVPDHSTKGNKVKLWRELNTCDNMKKLTLREWMERATKIHNGKFDYSLINNYTGSKDPVTIICPIHGPFSQVASEHLRGRGCRKCASGAKVVDVPLAEDGKPDWNKIFIYDDGKLHLKIRTAMCMHIGDVVGTYDRGGYCKIGVGGKRYQRHNIIWEMHNGRVPKGYVVDHINHLPDDDRLCNLRLVTVIENNRNRKLPKNNTSGCIGVTWHKRCKKWYVSVGKEYVGRFDDFFEACCARKSKETLYGYHENSGKRLETPPVRYG